MCDKENLTNSATDGATDSQRTKSPGEFGSNGQSRDGGNPLSRLRDRLIPQRSRSPSLTRPSTVSVADFSVVLRSADAISPGVSSRVTANDAAAIVSAVLVTYGIDNKPVKLNPPTPGLPQQIVVAPAQSVGTVPPPTQKRPVKDKTGTPSS